MANAPLHIALIGLENSTMDIVETYLSNWSCSLSVYDVWPQESPKDFPWSHVLCSLEMFESTKAWELENQTPVIIVLRRENKKEIPTGLNTKIAGTIFIPFEAEDLFMVLNQAPTQKHLSGLPEGISALQKDLPPQESQQEVGHLRQNHYLRVDQEKIDSVLNLIGELVVTKSQLLENETVVSNCDPKLSSVVSLLDKTIRELQDKSLSLRMTPLRPVFLKLQRVCRDLALKVGKSIHFEMQGAETEIDRLLIDSISDPLLHLCRNAIDHGIESEELRQNAGKSKTGRIKISAVQHASRIDVTISDDGAGLSKAKILSKAIEKHLVPPDLASSLSEKQVHDLIFQPGFSTSPKGNDVSGRGVGLSVVKSQIEEIRGEVSIETIPGKGTTFCLRLPLTTAITEGFLVKIGDQTCVIPLNRVIEFLEIKGSDIKKTNTGKEVIKLRECYVPFYRLHGFFRKKSFLQANKQWIAVIVDCDDGHCAILVDDVLGQSQIVAKSLGKTLESTQFAAGSAILGNGRIALILDIPGIVASLKTWKRTLGHAA